MPVPAPVRLLTLLGFRLMIGVGVTLGGWTAEKAGAAATRPATDAAPLGPGTHLRTVNVDGRVRSYVVHVPPAYDPARPTPVVVAFHGAMMNGPMMAAFTGLSDKADASNFVVVYPNGTGVRQAVLFFNASLPRPAKGNLPVDDVAFTAALLDDLARVVTVDPKRVFATGLSNGGMMANRVAAELSDRFAAAAPVAGTLAVPALAPKRPVPIILFHGTADWIVPFDGPRGQLPATMQFTGVKHTVDAWRAADGCPAEGKSVTTPDTAHDGTSVTTITYGPGAAGAEVVLVQINGGGHTWPGMTPPVAWIGTSTKNASANDLMWDFFCRHPMP